MAVPARKTSKSKKRLRRTHQKISRPEISYDEAIGDYRRSHRVSLKGYYKGKNINE
ncbi:50S ribosomal protein L32 [Tetragenococcus koreensis]|uniref:Large ribosomal subunit protein bL32 n=1 Tax=Tetragenococcus koreensis TaxID=290335 RepID=A0AAN4ZPQ4_9ENTE|nr:50S ribosomal protein L32 [Tetragenococcus koreensis]AYW46393.1 50S ribosomal protein L32 [Tetragenococcus koreensis]MCF1584799.1 50S ribosomal protein L32 [Tetragenococcus koreensis]MCF1614560.1 50S ribosomal protein L32 [Tetragenococcus koreensis]MCF1616721.1 50S ribosomal protein L32 [Tetragenococcus koreensis]MCF1619946.1 50S ribosomal protein L32 [Tetragenococcus koreensis]